MKQIITTAAGKVTIIGNNHPILLSEDYEAPEFYYKGNKYLLSDFVITDKKGVFKDYDGVLSDTAFSGLLVRLCDDNDHVKVYRFYC